MQGSSTPHVRAFRERMREQGLVKKDVWIRPEHAAELAAIEKAMREASRDAAQSGPSGDGKGPAWTLPTIRHALAQTSAVRDGAIVPGPVRSTDDLPRGIRDEQAPARYRLHHGSDEAFFGFAAPAISWKPLLFPSRRASALRYAAW